MEKYHFVSKQENENREKIWTKETWGMTMCLFGALVFLIMLFGHLILGKVGEGIVGFLLGSVGYFIFPACICLVLQGVCLIRDRSLQAPLRYVLLVLGIAYCVVAFVHTLMSREYDLSGFFPYLADCFRHGMNGYAEAPFGGIVAAIAVYPLLRYTTAVGSCIIFATLAVLLTLLFFFLLKGTAFPFLQKRENPAPPKEKKGFHPFSKKQEQPSREESIPRYTMEGASPSEGVGETYEAAEPDPQPLPKTYPHPTVRTVQEKDAPPMMQHSEAYLRSVANFDNKVNEILARREQDASMYRPASDDPDSDFQRRNEAFYEMANRVVNRPAQPQKNRDLFADHKPQEEYLPKPADAEEGRAILYPSEEYAKNSYQRNLIFNEDSDFNNRRTKPARAKGGYKPVVSYGDSYVSSLEESSGMPRKIVTDATTESSFQSAYGSGGNRTVESVPFDGGTPYRGDSPVPNPFRRTDDSTAFRPVPAERTSPQTDLFTRPSIEEYNKSDAIRMERAGRTASAENSFVRPSMANKSFVRPSTESYEPINPSWENLRAKEEDRTEQIRPSFDRQEYRPSAERTEPVRPSADRSEQRSFDRTEQIRPSEERREPLISSFDRTEQPSDRTTSSEEPDSQSDRPRTENASERGRENPLSISSIFSSRSNDTGRTRIDASMIPENRRFVDRSPMRSQANLFDAPLDEPSRAEETVDRALERGVSEQRSVPESKPEPKPAPRRRRAYHKPPMEMLEQYDEKSATSEEEVLQNTDTIVSTLGDFRIEAEVMKVTVGPTVTRYDIEIPRGIQAKKVSAYDEDLARRLHVTGGVTIYPNFESGYISIEVPNKKRSTVGLSSMLMDKKFQNSKPGSLTFAMGKDVEGRAIFGDIVKMTHMLVAGGTGSGKSVFLNEMIVSLIMKYSPDELRLILVDPKQVEFVVYKDMPHLMINEIVSDPTRVINILNWAIEEMNRRYALFRDRLQLGQALVRNIDEYNASLGEGEQKLPKIVMVVDELADLMLRAKKEIEDRIQNLTQKARAAGIHLIIATQRPSVDVVTGIIKSNLPTRVALRVTQEVDSRTILDDSGAEKLLGNGDMLYKTSEMPSPYRVQCGYVSSAEVQRIVEYVKENNEAVFDASITEYLNNAAKPDDEGEVGEEMDDGELDPVYIDALRYVVTIGQASISMIQRRCSVGYNRAGKIIEWMENMGYISPFEGAKARKVLLTKEEFEQKYGTEE